MSVPRTPSATDEHSTPLGNIRERYETPTAAPPLLHAELLRRACGTVATLLFFLVVVIDVSLERPRDELVPHLRQAERYVAAAGDGELLRARVEVKHLVDEKIAVRQKGLSTKAKPNWKLKRLPWLEFTFLTQWQTKRYAVAAGDDKLVRARVEVILPRREDHRSLEMSFNNNQTQ